MSGKHEDLFGGLTPPQPGSLTVYLVGPGYGESQVVVLPDGRWMVVDCCRKDGVNFTVALLQHFGAAKVDLFCLTHPDEDHYTGIAELLMEFRPGTLWHYPAFGTRLDLYLTFHKDDSDPERYKELQAAKKAIENIPKATVSQDIANWWKPTSSDYVVSLIAPCFGDFSYENDKLNSLFAKAIRGKLADNDKEFRRVLEDLP